MLNLIDLQDALSTVKYKPNFTIEIDEPDIVQGPYIHVYVEAVDSTNEINPEIIVLRVHSPIPPMESYEAFYNWLLWRLTRIEIHECMEFFKVDGKPYLDPHEPM